MFQDVIQQIDSGCLKEAFSLHRSYMQSYPNDVHARLLWIELLLFHFDFERARAELNQLPCDTNEMKAWIDDYIGLLNAEEKRSQFPRQIQPQFLIEPTEDIRLRLQGHLAWQQKDLEAAIDCFDGSLEQMPLVRGHVDGREFEEIRNEDDTLGQVIEFLCNGEYIWVPFVAIRKLRLEQQTTLRDRLFRPAMIALQNGELYEGYLPTRYQMTAAVEDELLWLGQSTDWTSDDSGLLQGLGAQQWIVGDEELTLSDFTQIEIRGKSLL